MLLRSCGGQMGSDKRKKKEQDLVLEWRKMVELQSSNMSLSSLARTAHHPAMVQPLASLSISSLEITLQATRESSPVGTETVEADLRDDRPCHGETSSDRMIELLQLRSIVIGHDLGF
jgi:hypothetical protein